MKKIKKTYRLKEITVDHIAILRGHYKTAGYDLSDANIIERAITESMAIMAERRMKENAIHNETDSPD